MRKRKKREAYSFILPSLATLVAIVIFPTIFLWYVSLTNYDLSMGWEQKSFVGPRNYFFLFFEDKDFWHSLRITLFFTAVTVSLEFVLGLGVALLFHRYIWGKRVWMSCLILPMVITPTIISLIWKLMLNTEYGVLNFILSQLGLGKVNWLGPKEAFWSLILVDVWEWTPFIALILYAGLQALPQEPYEAAVVDGANPRQIFFYLTLPLLKPMIIIALLLRSIDALKMFDVVYGLTQGGPGNATELMSLHIYRLGFRHTNWIGRASANAVILLFLSTLLTTVLLRTLRRERLGGA
ncbi:carbohydrate ABC transporter permease [Candidatus Caldatribacterium saccharofermentans]|uniref:carbohydrate ABC transporter permease n=1 Tax=Candidatus Caldatribacterium saccharofermentans TaxID=1454753 RepID=UPI003D082D67